MDAKTGGHFDGLYEISGTSMTGTQTTLTTFNSVKGAYLLTLKTDKKGKFTFSETFLTEVIEAEGTWDFNNGVGEEKNKESVTFNIDHVSSGISEAHFFN